MKHFLLIALVSSFISASYAQVFPAAHWEKVEHAAIYGWDTEKLNALEDYIVDSTATTGMMIIQNGEVIYQYGNVSENSYIASCRKSVLAMLYGKYVDDGTIQLNKSLADLGISYDGVLTNAEQQATVQDIISSRSGIYLPASNPGDMRHLAPARGSVKPRELWIYNNWDFNMAGYIFEQETQKNIYDEIETQFAIPLQMEDWDRSIQEKSGDLLTSDVLAYHIHFSARDMGRLGLLMLNKGQWMDEQLIPEQWVEETTRPSTTMEEVNSIAPNVKRELSQFSYGYMWWLLHNPKNKLLEGSYSAQGAWGQNITIVPEMNTVIVIKTNDIYLRQRGDHTFMIDQIAHAYNPELNKDLKKLSESLTQNDVQRFVKEYSAAPPTSGQVDYQNVVNQLGYHYLELKDFKNAFALFKLNVDQHPASWLAYDSLAEAYFMAGNYEESLKQYQKTMALNPENQWGNNERVAAIVERIKKKI